MNGDIHKGSNKINPGLEDKFLKIYKNDKTKAEDFAVRNRLYDNYTTIDDIDSLAKHVRGRQIFVKGVMLVVAGLLIFGIYKCSSSSSNEPTGNPKSTSVHPVEQWMSDYDGSIFEFEYQVKELLDDPSSFEHVETSYSEQGLETKVRMKFRAKNKFGAKVLNQADALLNTNDGTVSNITIK